MFYSLAGDLVLVIHLLAIVFVMVGGLLVYRWTWVVAVRSGLPPTTFERPEPQRDALSKCFARRA